MGWIGVMAYTAVTLQWVSIAYASSPNSSETDKIPVFFASLGVFYNLFIFLGNVIGFSVTNAVRNVEHILIFYLIDFLFEEKINGCISA